MLYQNKNNEVRQYTEIDKINGFIPKDFKQLTEAQLKAYNNKPDFGVWNGNEWIDARTPEEIEEQRKQNIQSQIDILESKTYRPLREMQVGTEEEMLQASIILGELNEQIKVLRGQL